MMGFDPMALLGQMLQRNPAIQQNPVKNSYIDAIRSGDPKRGEQIADNICRSYGKSREEMVAEAKRFFGIR